MPPFTRQHNWIERQSKSRRARARLQSRCRPSLRPRVNEDVVDALQYATSSLSRVTFTPLYTASTNVTTAFQDLTTFARDATMSFTAIDNNVWRDWTMNSDPVYIHLTNSWTTQTSALWHDVTQRTWTDWQYGYHPRRDMRERQFRGMSTTYNPEDVITRTERQLRVANDNAEADARARLTLLEHLTDEQRAMYEAEQRFIVVGRSGRRYEVKRGWVANIAALDDRGEPRHRLCCHIPGGVPVDDNVLAQKLALELDEDGFLYRANTHALPRAA